MMNTTRERLFRQISDAAGNVLYTYETHWNIVNRLKTRQTAIKIMQICLTALSTGGFLTSVIAGIPWLCWVGGLTSATSLGLNLYSLNFNLPTIIKNHTDAANELWDVREAYKSILIDYDEMTNEEIRTKRDKLTQAVSQINKKYPGTDDKAFATAKKKIQHHTFDEGESIKLLNVGVESKETNN